MQLGGSDPHALATSAKICEDFGYDEINLNVGCPSDRVQNGAFGACLMAEPKLVAECVKAMRDAVTIDVSVKHRIGIDDINAYGFVRDFVGTVAEAGCSIFIVHARNAILKGLTPKENREIPPLKYDFVYQLKRDFPTLQIIINGGVRTVEDINQHLDHLDGVMICREAYHNPWLLSDFDARYFGDMGQPKTRLQVVEAMLPYIQTQVATGGPRMNSIVRHMLGLMSGLRGARLFRQQMSDAKALAAGDANMLLQAAIAVIGHPAPHVQ